MSSMKMCIPQLYLRAQSPVCMDGNFCRLTSNPSISDSRCTLSRMGNAKLKVYEVGAAVCLRMALRPYHDYVGGSIFHALIGRFFFFSCGNLLNLMAHVEKIRVSVARLSIGAF